MKRIAAMVALAALAGCAGSARQGDLESNKPVLFLSIRSADDVAACVKPRMDHLARWADVVEDAAAKRLDITIYAERYPERQDYFLVRIQPTLGGSSTLFYSGGLDHARVSESQLEDLLRSCTT
ncbi:hypothetical protein [Bordetella genomosp. 13]|uniref:Lipoprotein n=1 Tax=Bordetella genomosp. 13 TaxID=463040 RepID=A0A1W6ZFW2_9BORD|nr:hypothetical protein [Bordetella genomosp. 13]ARP96030.1 hypothetical protein CAL15_17615 [Bordetella genomosp. 13]